MFSACNANTLKQYEPHEPKMQLEEYFNGPIRAWGVVQDWRGRVVSRFDVEMNGSWEGDVGTLEEKFVYYNDGKEEERIWTIRKTGEGAYEGSAGDILGKATGAQSGNAVNWSYKMDLPVNGKTYRITFDDWMWLLNDGVVINRSYLKKFGFTVAELTLFMQKQ